MTGGVEIERVFLLRAMPGLPPGAEAIEIEQGYLDPPADVPTRAGGANDGPREGRLRRLRFPDGRVEHQHAVKEGFGLIRRERERTISAAEFDRAWPCTAGRRLRKTRHRVREGDRVWEVDRFHELDLVLAEVELPHPDAAAPLPPWLTPFIVREVTDEPAYRNFSLARKAGLV